MAKGPLGNSPRDLRDEFVGENILYKGGEPPKKSRGPKKVTGDNFHTSVTGATSNKRPDRAGHFRSGGFVRGKSDHDADDKYKDGGKLTMGQRKAMPSSSFALPGKGAGPSGKGSGSYPINDPGHARAALSRASGKPVEAKVRAAVHRKYPGIGEK